MLAGASWTALGAAEASDSESWLVPLAAVAVLPPILGKCMPLARNRPANCCDKPWLLRIFAALVE